MFSDISEKYQRGKFIKSLTVSMNNGVQFKSVFNFEFIKSMKTFASIVS